LFFLFGLDVFGLFEARVQEFDAANVLVPAMGAIMMEHAKMMGRSTFAANFVHLEFCHRKLKITF